MIYSPACYNLQNAHWVAGIQSKNQIIALVSSTSWWFCRRQNIFVPWSSSGCEGVLMEMEKFPSTDTRTSFIPQNLRRKHHNCLLTQAWPSALVFMWNISFIIKRWFSELCLKSGFGLLIASHFSRVFYGIFHIFLELIHFYLLTPSCQGSNRLLKMEFNCFIFCLQAAER